MQEIFVIILRLASLSGKKIKDGACAEILQRTEEILMDTSKLLIEFWAHFFASF